MRTTCRLFMAAILFIAAAGFARAQDSASPPPVAPDAVVSPPAELPAIPSANPNPPAVEPALTIDESALTVEPIEPVVPATVEPVAPATAEKAAVTTTTKRVTKKAVKKPAEKPAEKPAIEASDSFKPGAAAASVAVADKTSNPPPPDAAAGTAQAKSIEPLPPAAAPAVETPTEETKSSRTMGIGGWLLAGLAVAALFVAITIFRRRKTRKPTSIVQLADLSMDLDPVPVTRP